MIRFNGGILRDIHTHFFYDIPRSVSVEIHVDEHLPREALSALRTMMKVPPRIITLDEPLNIDAQKSWDPGGKNRASYRGVRVNGRVGGDFTVLKSSLPRDTLLSGRRWFQTDIGLKAKNRAY